MKVRTQMMYDMETLLRKVFKQIRNEINEILDKELSRNEFTILRILNEQGPKKVTEFAPILEVSASHITAVTDALVEKEWITRIRSKEDRRIIRIHITEAGEKVLQHFNEKKTEYFFKRFDCYSDAELASLIELFSKLDKKR
ncbi:MarR family transcriptional regulator [Bacillus spizizenii]|uniref:MarR family transcriptional regulator n=2 Tax=Bacillus spizizenii TaxID=96241 RepID=A0A9Q4DTM1_BACSC|nr:MarR family transcriptional regulator [Bacillus spizizenii]KFI01310.1 MarR family transcriptional regulator [Bacillus sp. BSC154]MDU7577283.1 MarR family transcriptional regulator [Bacillus subtilis]ADM38163.1 putative transcriptional regulator (MarR family) protein [Bacillus spizizenii str. W23]AJW83760.1 MarR family transcriptional regulator [Bacillus spizizenii]EFG94220.1 putative transcriptional regulator (MarR family) protein [Bacillus spizizenii ATCC 6633 = JCM 2499]